VIRRVDVNGGQRALRVQVASGHADVQVEQSVLRGTSGQFAFGWQTQLNGTGTPSVDFEISNSYISGNRFGGFVAGLGSHSTFNVVSHANRYVQNGAGLMINPARDATALGGTAPGVHGNQATFLSDADDFIGNGGPYPGSFWPSLGGVVAITGLRTGPHSGPHSNNTMSLTVTDPRFADNGPADILAYGAVSIEGFPVGVPSTQTAGDHDLLYLSLDIGSQRGRFYRCDSIPFEFAGTNQVLVSGPDSSLVTQNCAVLQ
jgi:hypothetical protein